MSEDVKDNDEVLIQKIVQLLVSAESKENVAEVDRIRKSFQILEFVSAICIAEVAEDTDNLAEISTELHEGVTKLAVMIFDENQKLKLNEEKNQIGKENGKYIIA